MANGQMSINHYRFKNQTYATYTVINKKNNNNCTPWFTQIFYDVKRFVSCTTSSCCEITVNRDLKWHIADVISIIRMFHFGHNHLEPHSAHFSSRSFLPVSTNPCLRTAFPPASCDLHLLRGQTESSEDFFSFSFMTKPAPSLQAFTHRIL